YPHGVRVGSEAQRVLHEQGRPDINFAVYERIPPANRLAMANVLLGEIPATIKHLLEAAQLPAAQEHQLERVKVVDTLAQLPVLIDRHAALADRALLALGPPQEDASPALSKDQLYTPRRGDVKVPDLSEYQRQVLKETG